MIMHDYDICVRVHQLLVGHNSEHSFGFIPLEWTEDDAEDAVTFDATLLKRIASDLV